VSVKTSAAGQNDNRVPIRDRSFGADKHKSSGTQRELRVRKKPVGDRKPVRDFIPSL
jgi:hypothetical protein